MKKLFKYLIDNLKDWKTFLIFVVVCIVVGSEVWVSYLIALIVGLKTPLGITLSSFATACVIFWNLPFTPFLLICFSITMAIKGIWNKIKNKKRLP